VPEIKALLAYSTLGTWNYFELKRVDLETEVPIIDTKIDEEDARRNRFANIYWGVQKETQSLLDAQKLMRKKLFCHDGE
jgi:hypothetical protein